MNPAALLSRLEEALSQNGFVTPGCLSEGRDSVRGWLSPDGKFVNLGILTHTEYAQSVGSTEDDFYRKGWIRLTAYGSDAVMGNNPVRKWNSRQKDTAILLASEHWFEKVWFDDGQAPKVVWAEPT